MPGGFTIAADLEAEIGAGAILVVFGPSGAGKTTLLRHVAGLERPGEGVIRFGGESWCDTARGICLPPQQRRAAFVFQAPALFPHLTVGENIAFGRAAGIATPIGEIAALLGIEALSARLPRALSGGEAQRVALARALATGPRLLLLDEPFASLDAPARLRLRRDLRELLHRTGTPAVLVTHDRAEALSMGDRAAIVIAGNVRQSGGIAEVFSRPADAAVAASLGVEAVLPARVVARGDGLLEVAIGDAVLHVADREPIAIGTDVYACIRAEDVSLESGGRGETRASVRNHLDARVTAVAPEGAVERITLECGFVLDALITHRSREEMGLAPGARVTAAIKATSVHLVPRS
jgi:molybdate transport system ATP-binding protein